MSDRITQFLQDIMEDRWPGSPKAVLEEALRKWFEGGRPYPLLGALSKTDGEQWLVTYDSKHYDIDRGYGEFVCKFIPLAAVKKIIEECGRIYDERVADYGSNVLLDPEWQRISRDQAVEAMAVMATRRFLIGMGNRLCDAVEDSLDESLLLAKAAIQGSLKTLLEGEYTEERTPVDCRQDISDAMERVAIRERAYRESLLSRNVPKVQVSGPGRRAGSGKSVEDRLREKLEFEQEIEGAIRGLFSLLGRMPTKTRVAEELNIGSSLSSGGNNTRLSTFNNKLDRRGVDYDAITKKLELELNK